MVQWRSPKPKDYNWVRPLDDSPIRTTTVDSATGIRTGKDQEMDKEVDEKPWILKRASNWVSGLRNANKVGINPKDALGAAKVPMHLVPPSSTILQALCMDDGAIKYGPYNIRMEDIQAIGYISAAKRHLDAYMDGQDFDSTTGKPHLGYALATIGLVIDAWLNGTLIDNRPVPGVGGQLLDELAMKPNEEPRSPAQFKAIFQRIAEFGELQTEERRRGDERE